MFIDTFMFNGDWITKLRLEYLYDYVDYFYVVESRYTYSGKRKDRLYVEIHSDWFLPYIQKVKILVNERPAVPNAWEEEAYQRNLVVGSVLRDFPDSDFLLAVCDCDEVYDISRLPPKEELRDVLKTRVLFPQMNFYYYNFTHIIDGDLWTNPFIMHSDMLRTFPSLTEVRVNKHMRGHLLPTIRMPSGWHFSYFSSLVEMKRKIQSFSHTELDREENTNLTVIEKRVKEGKDIFGRENLKLREVEFWSFDNKYPLLFQKYQEELLALQSA